MKKASIALLLLLSIGTADAVSRARTPEPAPSPSPVSMPAPAPGDQPKVFFRPILNANKRQDDLLIKAQFKMSEVFHSDCFAAFLMTRQMIQTGGLGNGQIVERLRAINGMVPIDVYHVPWYQPWGRSVDGYRNPGENVIHIRDTSVSAADSVCSVASLVGHELSHLGAGFEHDYYWSPSREYSIPYSINAAFTACCLSPAA